MSRSNNTISRRNFIAGVGAGAVLGLQPGLARAADPVTLKFATNDTTADASYTIAQRFGADIAKRTNDKYRVQVFVGGALGSGVNVVSSLQTGIIDCAIVTTGFLASFVPSVQVVDLPFLFKDRATAERILDGDVGRKIFADMDSRNIVGLAWGWYGWRQVETREKAVTGPDDLRGLKMRIQPSPVFAAMLKAVGAIPIVMDGSEVYLALSQKTIDGVEFPLPTVVTFKMYEVNKFLALTNHVYNAGALLVSKARWSQMTPADREAFQAAATAVRTDWRNEIATNSDNAAKFCKEHGMTITDTNFKAFQAKMEPVYTEFKPKYLELFNMIMAQQ
jgi:tripartite ATP-independent transporter DctP family solute receptor